jgi:crotonobetainyl-CoA:carnitine CoA-transferase CaiB-like acyl-CoA transferase
MQHAVQAAIARFPDRGHAIEELAGTDESFRLLCEDLAEAQVALAQWEHSSSPVKEARCAEYRELVRDLAAELATELDRYSQG